MQRKALKFRLYPTSAQETTLRQTLETCRGVYNSLLHERKRDFERFGKSPSKNEQTKHFPIWKEAHPELADVFSQVLQNVATRVDLAFAAFFRRVKAGEKPGFPRFKGRGQYDSITYPQFGFSLHEASITLCKIGTIKAVVHRTLACKIKTCTVSRHGEKWYVCLAVEVENEPLPESAQTVGIDVGLEHFAATSDDEFIANPRFFRQEEKALVKASRKFDKVKHQPRNEARRKAKKVVARVQERIRNRRHNFVHQTARKLVNRFGLIAVEALNVQNMSARPAPKQDEETGEYLPNGAAAKSGLNKSICDASWSMFRAVLTHKAESAGRVVIAVHPAYTSQDCSECGNRVPKPLSARWHLCTECGLSVHRDTNSARAILKKAVGQHSFAVAASGIVGSNVATA